MQLFQLVKEQLRFIQGQAPKLKEMAAGEELMFDVDIPLLSMAASAPESTAEPASNVPDIILQLRSRDGHALDKKKVEEGVTDFVHSALLLAFNMNQPQLPPDDMPVVKLVRDEGDHPRVYLRFGRLAPEDFKVSAVAQSVDNFDKMMFSGWRRVHGTPEPMLRKRFANEEQAVLVEHLLACMGRAAGYSEKDVIEQFDVSPRDNILTVHKEFLAYLAEVEQTHNADFGKRRQ